MLCNTSLNDKGEPIIDTAPEAIDFCLRRRIGVALFNGAGSGWGISTTTPRTGRRPGHTSRSRWREKTWRR
ncbi:hypothetical protein GCM10009660_04790 [Catellatospora bangladeshensis]|uniref:Uncharacterized protein n=1 Tax=Saccharothrix algeriensis TaxID=173560 RepID=A0ABS2S0C9_9PSEU|nr:hypothetical protein [Saccharothrix algeriensis]